MTQHAWLDHAFGLWHLVTEDDEAPVRYWTEKESALAELAGEG